VHRPTGAGPRSACEDALFAVEAKPQGTLTIMFEDLEGSTAFVSAHGDEAWREVQRIHDHVVRGELEPRDASDVVFLGDGYLASFARPADALDAAVAIQQAVADHHHFRKFQPLRVRVGIHTGEVSRDERGNLVGAAVHAASRITGKAGGAQIFVSQVIRDAGTDRVFADRGLFWLKGFPERWRLFELLWNDAPTAQTGSSTKLVGRDDEIADLRRLCDQSIAGRGHLALIGGEPGVGKTSLAEEVMADATARGALTLAGHCYQMEAPPYIPIVEILESIADLLPPDVLARVLGPTDGAQEIARMWPGLHRFLPDLAAPLALPPEQARRYLFTCLTEALDRLSRLRLIVMLVDDLQWADPSTLLFLQHLTQHLQDMPLFVLGTYRDIELKPGVPFAETFESLIRQPAVDRFTLKRLARDGVAGVLASLADREPPPRLVDVVYSETEGNPFFVEEVFHHLAEEGKLFDAAGEWRTDIAVDESDVPQSVRLLLGRRIAHLSDRARDVLTTAAVAGRGVGLLLLQHIQQPDQNDSFLDALDEAERAHLISFDQQPRDTGLLFSHELIRQTLIADLPTLRRQRIHAQVAEALEGMYAGDADPSVHGSDLCYHLLQAGPLVDPAKTVHQLLLAGNHDIDAAAFEEALRRFEQALALEPGDERTKADVEFGLGTALRGLGRWDEAVERWKRAIDDYVRLGEREAAGRAAWYATEQLMWIARWDEALVVASDGLNALEDIANGARVGLTADVAAMFSAGGYNEAANRMFAEAEAMAGDLGEPALLGQVLSLETMHMYFCGQPRAAIAVGARSAKLLRAAGDSWNLANALSFVALTAPLALDFDTSRTAAAETTELAERLGHLPARWLAHRSSWLETEMSADPQALERFHARDNELLLGLPWGSGSLNFSAEAAFRRGRWDEANRDREASIDQEVSEALRPSDVGMLMLGLAYTGDRERAMEIYAAEVPGLTGIGDTASIGTDILLTAVVEALWLLGEHEEAARHHDALLQYADRTGTAVRAWDARLIETLAGIAAAAGRDWDTAERHFEAAIAQAEALPHAIESADARRFYAQMLAERDAPGDRDRARALLTDAIDWYARLEMPRHKEMTDALLTGLATRP
jgi:class 3 adenylate cyclase/tetratricopeptide (TPR) repeat protein